MDKIDAKTRSQNMANIKAKNTKPELLLRKSLFKKGYRYRTHYPLKGKPDIVFVKKKLAIFVNGCFWHGHGCKVDHVSKSNVNFWSKKITNNKKRDGKVRKVLSKDGWKIIVVWECDIRDNLTSVTKGVAKIIEQC
jgi:DNA mismatch endonuclease (patch repair protein)